MPKQMEKRLKEVVEKTYPHWDEERKNAYIYGTMREQGWKPEREKKKGKGK